MENNTKNTAAALTTTSARNILDEVHSLACASAKSIKDNALAGLTRSQWAKINSEATTEILGSVTASGEPVDGVKSLAKWQGICTAEDVWAYVSDRI